MNNKMILIVEIGMKPKWLNTNASPEGPIFAVVMASLSIASGKCIATTATNSGSR